MKWVILTGFLVLLGHGEGNVLRCSPNEQDGSCSTEEDKALPPSAVVLDEAPSIECLAGSEWESNCHYCRCSDAGTAECLKQTTCEENFFAETKKADQPLPAGKDCAIGSTWRSKCQECACSETGYVVCNMTACLGKEEPEYPQCAPNSAWRNDCNRCTCSSDGLGSCTEIACISNEGISDIHPEKKMGEESIVEPGTFQETNYSEETNTDSEDEQFHKVFKRSVCKPNQEFQNECNMCRCSADGQTYTCTQAECLERDMTKEVEVFMETEGEDHVERHSVCQPANTFYIGCNTCHCNYDGSDYSCTNKPCPLPDDVELFHELRLLALKGANQNQTCKAKAMFIKDCNICWCNEYGTDYFCTRKVCVPDLPDEPTVAGPEELRILKKECRPYEVFELDCNMCRCNPDGKSFSCTRRACLDLEDKEAKVSLSRRIRATPQESPKACQPGQEFRLDCNKCLCDNEGLSFSCTRIDCAAQNSGGNNRSKREVATATEAANSTLVEIETSCTPGSVFNAECNACRCSEGGRSAKCTQAKCTPNHLDSKVHEPESDPGFRCNPGEQFKKDCNDCTCSADGRSTFCTLHLCEESFQQSLSP